MLVSTSIPNLVNGVSQQPDAVRLTSQCQLQENGYSSVVQGVSKRPPFKHIAQLFNTTGFDSAYFHTINRDLTERYAVVITNGDLKVFDIAGNAKTVTFPNGKAYLTNATPSQGFSALTVADFTFITNKAINTAMAGTVSATRNKEALVYVKQGQYGTGYAVNLNGFVATFTTSPTDPTTIVTASIAAQIVNLLLADATTAANFNISLVGSGIYIQRKIAATDFTLVTQDGQGDTFLIPIKDTIQLFSNLPPKAPNGYQVKVTGDSHGQFTGYYVQYVTNGTGVDAGTWVECPGQNVATTLDNTTMPWQLVRNGDGTFTFKPATWAPLSVGDAVSAPQPSFIGHPINDIFFHRDRLGFLSDENVIMSKTGFFFNFWPDTVTQVLATDRIDVGVTTTVVSTLRAALPFNDQLILFADQLQFVLDSGGQILSPTSVSIQPVVGFENDSRFCKPAFTGKVIYFPIPRGSFEGFREYQTLPLNNQNDAVEVTSHVQTYIPSGVFKVATSANDGMMAVLTTGDRAAIYVYKWLWNGEQKLQSAWSRWPLDANDIVLGVDFIQTDMYVIVQRSDGVYLEVAHLALGTQDTGFAFQVNLDRQLFITGSYSAITNKTTWTLPYAGATGVYQVILGPAFSTPMQTGIVLNTTMPSSTTLTAVGNFSAGPCYVGRQYTFRYRFSKQFVREYVKGQGYSVTAITEGRLQLRHFDVTYQSTGYFRAEVTPLARAMYTYVFSGHLTGIASNMIGNVVTSSGSFKFPVLSDASTAQIDIVNDTYQPSTILAAEWEGEHFIRSQRI